MEEIKKEKCLVTEAQNKCKCSWCEMFRKARASAIAIQIGAEILEEARKRDFKKTSPPKKQDNSTKNSIPNKE